MCDNHAVSRRSFLKSASCGFGALALAGLATEAAAASDNPLAPKAPHFPAKAKRVIFLFMQGGPSHVDTFDYKPLLKRDDGKPRPGGMAGGKGGGALLAPQFEFKQHGQSGQWISSLFPHVAEHADEITILNGMYGDSPAHPQASIQMHTGTAQFVRPSMGSWVLYGLGTPNQNLPGFISINPVTNFNTMGAAFLPAAFQGTSIGRGKTTIPNVTPALPAAQQRRQLDLVQSMNRDLLDRSGGDTEIEGVIESMELAYRMQSSVPDVIDLSKESKATRELYGPGEFAEQCLLARRFAEAGVRFIELSYRGWDQHNNLHNAMTRNAQATDQGIAGLLEDLRQRGMLNETLVVWGGEFGRTPSGQGRDGRNHNNRGFSMWMAGGGVKGGQTYGATDDYGFAAVKDKTHVHDLHATILNCLGLDHERLTYRYAGRDFRLTDVSGTVVKPILA
ncbi:MAG TPA: DUF1501 domain-containing protein [Planctomycetota bacterium]|nr:DUF1501 domain-containing protein [Planctomycetota bacterium]